MIAVSIFDANYRYIQSKRGKSTTVKVPIFTVAPSIGEAIMKMK